MMKAPGALLAQKSLVAPELHRSRVGIGSESEARQMGFRLDTPKRFRVTPDSLPLLQRGSTAASRRLGPCDPGHRRRVTERVIWFLRAAKPLRQAGSAGTAAGAV